MVNLVTTRGYKHPTGDFILYTLLDVYTIFYCFTVQHTYIDILRCDSEFLSVFVSKMVTM